MLPIQYNPPDAEAMERLIYKHRYDTVSIIVLLAWRTGLSRKEISELTWEQVDLDAELLRLPDREIPIPSEMKEPLQKWRNHWERVCPYVAVSPLRRKRLVKETLSNMVRRALDEEGQKDVRLQDLRHDFIQRQLQEHDWPYVLRVSGLSVSTYRSGLHGIKAESGGDDNVSPEPEFSGEGLGEELKLWRVLQAERGTPAGIALWLSSRAGLQVKEIAALTWDQVDFESRLLHLPNQDVEISVSVCHVLEDEKARRGVGDDPHVVLSPRSRKPVNATWLTTLVRSALIHGGIENHTLRHLRMDPGRETENRKIIAYVDAHGFITRNEAVALLGLSEGQVYRRLSALTKAGKLDRVNTRYFHAGTVILPEQRPEAVRRYLQENGAAYLQDIADFLQQGKMTTLRFLRKMVRSGRLTVLQNEKYDLPPEDKGLETPLEEAKAALG